MSPEQLQEFRKQGKLLDPKYDSLAYAYKGHTDKIDENNLKNEMPNDVETLGDTKNNGKANGYYFGIDGTFYGREGQSNNLVICSEKKQYTDKDKSEGWLYMTPIHTDFEFNDIDEIAALIYAEGSIKHIKDITDIDYEFEAFALGTTIINYKLKRKHDESPGKPYNPTYAKILTDMRAYGKGTPLYDKLKKTELLERNGTKMQVCMAASINALCYEFIKSGNSKFSSNDELNFLPFDRSNNAILWDGIDLKNNYDDPHPKIKQGYFVSDEDHNVLDIKSKKTTEDGAVDGKVCLKLHSQKDPSFEETKCYEYTYKTTFGVAKTMFVKLTDQFEAAIIHSKREIKNGKYVLSQWW